jgi:hypothetical protein
VHSDIGHVEGREQNFDRNVFVIQGDFRQSSRLLKLDATVPRLTLWYTMLTLLLQPLFSGDGLDESANTRARNRDLRPGKKIDHKLMVKTLVLNVVNDGCDEGQRR